MRKNTKKYIFTLLLLILCASAVLFAWFHFSVSKEKNLSGSWNTSLDMTGRSAVTALDWLQDIEGVSVSLEDMESCMQNLKLQINLTFEQTSRFEGTFLCTIPPESYEACRQAAYEAFAAAFRELLAERLRMADYAGNTDEESVEALVAETFGMSTVAYLISCGPALLPSLEELQAQFGSSGTYTVAGDILIRNFSTGESDVTRQERYIRQDSTLILCEEADDEPLGFLSDYYPVIYTLEESVDQ